MEKRDEFAFLKQLINSLNESFTKMQESYEKRDYEEFNKSKKMFLNIQKNIQDSLDSK
jgi:hypothetical protein